MKALVKVHVTLHIEDPDAPSLDSFVTPKSKEDEIARRSFLAYPMAEHVAGMRDVTDVEDAKRLINGVKGYIDRGFQALNIDGPGPIIVREVPPPKDEELMKNPLALVGVPQKPNGVH